MDCSPPGSFIHRVFQARVPEWVAISFSWGPSWPRDRTRVSRIADRRLTVWATREAPQERGETEAERRDGKAVLRRGLCPGPWPRKPDRLPIRFCWVTLGDLTLPALSLSLKWACYSFCLPGLLCRFLREGVWSDMPGTESVLCVRRFSSRLWLYLLLLFLYSVTWLTFPFLRCVLDDPNTDFHKGKGEPSMPACFRIYVLALWLCSFGCC